MKIKTLSLLVTGLLAAASSVAFATAYTPPQPYSPKLPSAPPCSASTTACVTPVPAYVNGAYLYPGFMGNSGTLAHWSSAINTFNANATGANKIGMILPYISDIEFPMVFCWGVTAQKPSDPQSACLTNQTYTKDVSGIPVPLMISAGSAWGANATNPITGQTAATDIANDIAATGLLAPSSPYTDYGFYYNMTDPSNPTVRPQAYNFSNKDVASYVGNNIETNPKSPYVGKNVSAFEQDNTGYYAPVNPVCLDGSGTCQKTATHPSDLIVSPLIDGRLDNGYLQGMDMMQYASANALADLVAFGTSDQNQARAVVPYLANSTAPLLSQGNWVQGICTDPNIDGIQLDLEPFNIPANVSGSGSSAVCKDASGNTMGCGEYWFYSRIAYDLASTQCRDETHPNGKFFSIFTFADRMNATVAQILNQYNNGYVVDSIYDIPADTNWPVGGNFNATTPTYYCNGVGTDPSITCSTPANGPDNATVPHSYADYPVKYVQAEATAMVKVANQYNIKFQFAVPAAGSAHEFESWNVWNISPTTGEGKPGVLIGNQTQPADQSFYVDKLFGGTNGTDNTATAISDALNAPAPNGLIDKSLFRGIVLWGWSTNMVWSPNPTVKDWDFGALSSMVTVLFNPSSPPQTVLTYLESNLGNVAPSSETITINPKLTYIPGTKIGTFYASVGWNISQPAPAGSTFELYVNNPSNGTWTFTKFPATGPYSAVWGQDNESGNNQMTLNLGTPYVGYIQLMDSTGHVIASANAPILGYTITVTSVSYESHGSTYDAPVSWMVIPNPPANSTLRLYVNSVSDGTWSFTKFPASGPYSAYWGQNGDSGNNEMTMTTGTKYVGYIDLLNSNGDLIGTVSAPLNNN